MNGDEGVGRGQNGDGEGAGFPSFLTLGRDATRNPLSCFSNGPEVVSNAMWQGEGATDQRREPPVHPFTTQEGVLALLLSLLLHVRKCRLPDTGCRRAFVKFPNQHSRWLHCSLSLVWHLSVTTIPWPSPEFYLDKPIRLNARVPHLALCNLLTIMANRASPDRRPPLG